MRQNSFDNHYFTAPVKNPEFCPSIQIEGLETDVCYLLCWIDGKFSINNFQPIFKVFFRRIEKFSENGEIVYLSDDDFIYASLSLYPLKYLCIGSIVLNNKKVAEIDLPNAKLKIDANYREVSISDLGETIINDAPLFFPPNKKQPSEGGFSVLKALIPKSLFSYEDFLVFKRNNGGKIYIAKIEYFLALFGVSVELKRILLSNTYREIIEIFKLEDEIRGTSKCWYIPPFSSTRYEKHDAVFLAHLKYTKETQFAVKKLTTSVFANKVNNLISFTHKLSIRPWHNQPIEIIASGFPIQGSNDFFVSKIEAFSDPIGKDIIVRKDKRERAFDLNIVPEEESDNPVKRITKLDENIPIVSGSTDSSVMNSEIPLYLQLIGNERKIIIENILKLCTHSSKPALFGQEPSAYSDAPVSGSDSDIGGLVPKIGQQATNTKDDIELRSYIKEAIDASNKLLNEGIFTLIEYYDGNKFRSDGDFGVFKINENSAQKKKANFQHQLFKGYALLLRLHNEVDTFLCMELQGTDRVKRCGLLVKITDVNNEKAFLKMLIDSVILHNGVFRSIANNVIYSKSKVYRHSDGAVEKRLREFCSSVR